MSDSLSRGLGGSSRVSEKSLGEEVLNNEQALGNMFAQVPITGDTIEKSRMEIAKLHQEEMDAAEQRAYQEAIEATVAQNNGNIDALTNDNRFNTKNGMIAMGNYMKARADNEDVQKQAFEKEAAKNDWIYQNKLVPGLSEFERCYEAGDMDGCRQALAGVNQYLPLPYQISIDGDGNGIETFRKDGQGWVQTGRRYSVEDIYNMSKQLRGKEVQVLSGVDMSRHLINPAFRESAFRYQRATVQSNAEAMSDPSKWLCFQDANGKMTYAIPQNSYADMRAPTQYKLLTDGSNESGYVTDLSELTGRGLTFVGKGGGGGGAVRGGGGRMGGAIGGGGGGGSPRRSGQPANEPQQDEATRYQRGMAFIDQARAAWKSGDMDHFDVWTQKFAEQTGMSYRFEPTGQDGEYKILTPDAKTGEFVDSGRKTNRSEIMSLLESLATGDMSQLSGLPPHLVSDNANWLTQSKLMREKANRAMTATQAGRPLDEELMTDALYSSGWNYDKTHNRWFKKNEDGSEARLTREEAQKIAIEWYQQRYPNSAENGQPPAGGGQSPTPAGGGQSPNANATADNPVDAAKAQENVENHKKIRKQQNQGTQTFAFSEIGLGKDTGASTDNKENLKQYYQGNQARIAKKYGMQSIKGTVTKPIDKAVQQENGSFKYPVEIVQVGPDKYVAYVVKAHHTFDADANQDVTTYERVNANYGVFPTQDAAEAYIDELFTLYRAKRERKTQEKEDTTTSPFKTNPSDGQSGVKQTQIAEGLNYGIL